MGLVGFAILDLSLSVWVVVGGGFRVNVNSVDFDYVWF